MIFFCKGLRAEASALFSGRAEFIAAGVLSVSVVLVFEIFISGSVVSDTGGTLTDSLFGIALAFGGTGLAVEADPPVLKLDLNLLSALAAVGNKLMIY